MCRLLVVEVLLNLRTTEQIGGGGGRTLVLKRLAEIPTCVAGSRFTLRGAYQRAPHRAIPPLLRPCPDGPWQALARLFLCPFPGHGPYLGGTASARLLGGEANAVVVRVCVFPAGFTRSRDPSARDRLLLVSVETGTPPKGRYEGQSTRSGPAELKSRPARSSSSRSQCRPHRGSVG